MAVLVAGMMLEAIEDGIKYTYFHHYPVDKANRLLRTGTETSRPLGMQSLERCAFHQEAEVAGRAQ